MSTSHVKMELFDKLKNKIKTKKNKKLQHLQSAYNAWKISKGPKNAPIIPNFELHFITLDRSQHNKQGKMKIILNLGKPKPKTLFEKFRIYEKYHK